MTTHRPAGLPPGYVPATGHEAYMGRTLKLALVTGGLALALAKLGPMLFAGASERQQFTLAFVVFCLLVVAGVSLLAGLSTWPLHVLARRRIERAARVVEEMEEPGSEETGSVKLANPGGRLRELERKAPWLGRLIRDKASQVVVTQVEGTDDLVVIVDRSRAHYGSAKARRAIGRPSGARHKRGPDRGEGSHG